MDSDHQPNVNFEQVDCCTARLTDFGFSTPYMRAGEHIKEDTVSRFVGNMMFASGNAFNFRPTSRRDDLISLSYLLVYLLNPNQLTFIKEVRDMNVNDKFKHIKEKKQTLTPK